MSLKRSHITVTGAVVPVTVGHFRWLRLHDHIIKISIPTVTTADCYSCANAGPTSSNCDFRAWRNAHGDHRLTRTTEADGRCGGAAVVRLHLHPPPRRAELC